MLLQEKISLYKDLIKNNLPSFALNNLDVFSGEQSGYRMRAEFGVFHQNTPNYQVLHFTHDPKTKERVFCHGHFDIATPLINSLMLALEEFCSQNYKFSHKLFQIEYLTTTTKQVIISLLFHRKLHEEQDLEKAQQLQAFLLQKNLIPTQEINIILRARKNKIIVGNNFIKEKFIVDNQEVSLYQVENSFSQPNAQINELMLNYVKEHASTKNDILELYCGVGNFTMVLAQIRRKVLATEVNKQAVEFVYKNLALNNIHNVEVGRISAEEFVQAINKVRPFRRLEHIDLDSFNFDTVFVDPPRSGLDQESCDMISKYPQIIYVSCNPQTLVKNLQYLIEQHNYQIKHLSLFDQFPQTSHCESVAILQRN